jgi:hypothetical protein
MRGIAETHSVSVAQIALAWLLHQKVVSSVIVGAKRLDQLEDNLGAVDVSLTHEEQATIAEVSKIPAEIDYRSKRIWFGDSEPMATALPLEPSRPYPILKATIDGFPVTLMIDTGCEGVVLFANRFPKGLKKDYFQASRAVTVAGESPLIQIGSGKLAVGTAPAHSVALRIIATGTNNMGYDGIVGVRALHASRMQFNYERMTVNLR